MKPETDTVVVLSTAHVQEDTMDALGHGLSFTTVYESNSGVFMWVPEEKQLASISDSCPVDLFDVLCYVRRFGSYLLLDRDGLIVDELKTYDW